MKSTSIAYKLEQIYFNFDMLEKGIKMSENIALLQQQIDDCKTQLQKDRQAFSELQTRQNALAESMEALGRTLAGLDEKMAVLAPQAEPSAHQTTSDSPVLQALPEPVVSEEPYPEQRLAGFIPLKVLAEERERLVPHIQTVRDSEFFDAEWYLEAYPDIKDSGYAEDPAMHYLLFGGFEGRHPGPLFNSIAYYLESPDVYQNQMNPLVHYSLFGRNEGRKVFPL
ncbi:hypothetical protein E0L35_14005 [Halomonas sp. ATBC28]|uniref:hypothetical protein n=2 Tax=Oceanospirillales TaxID=135619 RepID=UPI00110DDDC2|nr:hypothetical protein [Halomonas sp. ATBC28]TMU23200.1 hypothetical protein E0L35_14005 [Halomonas sp. ATBC28]